MSNQPPELANTELYYGEGLGEDTGVKPTACGSDSKDVHGRFWTCRSAGRLAHLRFISSENRRM